MILIGCFVRYNRSSQKIWRKHREEAKVLRNIMELTTLNDSAESLTMTGDAVPGQDKGICKSNTAAALALRAACGRIKIKDNTH